MTGKTGGNRSWQTETTAVHAGEFVDPATRASSPNLVMSVTFAPERLTGFSARDTCLMMKRNAPAGDLRKALTHHLLDDMRIRWALESGKTPAGPVEILPGGRQEWKRDVEAWIKDGMLCE